MSRARPLVVGAAALVVLPLALQALGLSISTATQVVCLAIAALGLNMLVGYTGLTSFGHSAWFGIGAYAAAIAQREWFPGQIALPLAFAVLLVAALSALVGLLILRRRGVYFALLTLAFVALTYTVAFRWTELTGGEDGLGGLVRGGFAFAPLDHGGVYYAFVAVIAFAVLYALLRVTRSPFGHVLVAIRENQQRATFQGYPVDRYRLAAFVLSAAVTALAGALLAFLNYLVSAESVSVAFSGELLAMVVIGGMHQLLGPALGVLFYILFRELSSIWTQHWLLWFGLVFVGFVLYSPEGLAGIWEKLRRRLRPPPAEAAAMDARRIAQGVPLPAFLRAPAASGDVLQLSAVSRHFGGIRAVAGASLAVRAGEIHALIGPNGAGKTTLFNIASGLFPPDGGRVVLCGEEVQDAPTDRICRLGLARSFQITNLFKGLTIYENLRLSVQARHRARFDAWRDIDAHAEIHAETKELVRFLGLEGIEEIRGGDLSYGGQRLLDLGIALGSAPRVLLLDEPLAGLAAAERERVSRLVQDVAAGVPVLIVEHDIDRVLGISQVVTVMNQGEVLMSGSPQAVRDDRRVQEVYTGSGSPPARARTAAAGGAPLLRFEKVNAFYGKSHILTEATLDVREGEIVALLGRNGAGKTSTLRSIARVGSPMVTHGEIWLDHKPLHEMKAFQASQLGVALVPEDRRIIAGLTVEENLQLAQIAPPKGWSIERIYELFPRLGERRKQEGVTLSGGEQQMLAIGRALARDIKLLLLDEPYEGLAPVIVHEIERTLAEIKKLGITTVIVEQNAVAALQLADRAIILDMGQVVFDGTAQEVLDNEELRHEYLAI